MNHDTSGTRRGHYRLGLDNPVFDDQGKSVLSVEDLALVIVDELEHLKRIRGSGSRQHIEVISRFSNVPRRMLINRITRIRRSLSLIRP